MTSPTTEAGKRLLERIQNLPVHTPAVWTNLGMRGKFFLYQSAVDAVVTPDAIAVIEAEARADVLRELRAEVEAMPYLDTIIDPEDGNAIGGTVDMTAVLHAIDRLGASA